MDEAFWHERWKKGETAFHEGRPNRFLVAHFASLGLAAGARVFMPLCGKSVDIHWMLAEGFRVVGIDLSAIAISQLFDDLALTPVLRKQATGDGELILSSADRIDIFVGDLFALDAASLGPVDAVYDRAALVALPPPMRERYAHHIARITNTARQLVVSFDYDQALFDGPPFSVPQEEVERLYGPFYEIENLQQDRVPGGLKRRAEVDETALRLTKR
ncbi:thiopurine S-methyltransferase [Fulvimarina sp. 2208YS6-2-32]|uniref:Thiopurine S-methyltransferase n=1 Tax=Fulvimarina uroteuthidis TaxID=3098149 RepID=A0ABU5I0E9_9HYPH|nr:thiopurine S-methyltransferase [Fulvimarina sp. 2208YS6-2-32]MDY8107646.1 thiopurine S-methyltransferase [Fulvimarina sp. 2208YS6-2-32]